MSSASLRLVCAGWKFTLLLLGCLPAAAQQTTFAFHSNSWVNLHHYLYEQAIAKTPEASESADWQHALEAYRRDITPHELLSRDIAGINSALSIVDNAESLKGSGLDAELAGILERAAPVYRARWWPQHNRANLAWIAAATPLVAKYEAVMKKELSTAYQTPWPSEPIHTDVAEYASWARAYTIWLAVDIWRGPLWIEFRSDCSWRLGGLEEWRNVCCGGVRKWRRADAVNRHVGLVPLGVPNGILGSWVLYQFEFSSASIIALVTISPHM